MLVPTLAVRGLFGLYPPSVCYISQYACTIFAITEDFSGVKRDSLAFTSCHYTLSNQHHQEECYWTKVPSTVSVMN